MNNIVLMVCFCFMAIVVSFISLAQILIGMMESKFNVWVIMTFAASSFIAMALKRAIPTSKTHVGCPDCKEVIVKNARVCKFCGCKLIPSTD